ncbi:MAG TPA: hybrid sensor histidine kinase/response regulator [Longimicrobiaceae bacterium]|nr:hybrid sensor histidine kinase/response regulator [Longimicrobiaceae bacterium]
MARVLVIDDQKIPRVTVAAMLSDAGHEVATEASGAAGLERAREWLPDVIVLDVYMPEMDGFAVVEELKRDPDTAPTPVVFLTAEPPTDELIVRGLDLGAYDFLSKGCSRGELLARVGVMSRIKRGNDELSAIASISDTLLQTLDPQYLSQRFVDQVQQVFRADAALLAYSRPESRADCVGAGISVDDPLCETLAEAITTHLIENPSGAEEVPVDDLAGPAGTLVRRKEYRSIVGVLIHHENRRPSLLSIFSTREHGFARESDGPLLQLLTRQATIALDNAFLHLRTREQARKMEEQAVALERAMTDRSRFFASMSHELRTPINAVIGYTQLLEEGAYGEMEPEQKNAVSKVGRSAHHLMELINDVLDLSKLEAGKLAIYPEPINLSNLLHDTATSIQLQAEAKELELKIECPREFMVVTDPARVRQIILNLLSNAVKFTDAGEVKVTLCPPESDGGGASWVRVTVDDTGPGISPEDKDRIFEEFEQSPGAAGRGGTGLGLAISRKLAHLLGGDLQVDSTPGTGSTFTLSLPDNSEEAKAA